MKIYVKLSFQVQFDDTTAEETFIDRLNSVDTGLCLQRDQSFEYTRMLHGNTGYIVRVNGENGYHQIALISNGNGQFNLANINWFGLGSISMEDYNQIASRLAKVVRTIARRSGLHIRVKAKDEAELTDIITGTGTRKYFLNYLNACPLSWHPFDIDRLDTFICALHRHGQKRIDLHLLQRFLQEEQKWEEDDASKLIDRIDVGLNVLKQNARFSAYR